MGKRSGALVGLIVFCLACGDEPPPGESTTPPTQEDTAARDADRALAGCQDFWQRYLSLDQSPPPFGGPAVAAQLKAVLDRERPAALSPTKYIRSDLGEPGSLDANGNHVFAPRNLDPWGRPYVFEVRPDGVSAVSSGPDRQLGSFDDVRHPPIQ
jgi:hypothetical protein